MTDGGEQSSSGRLLKGAHWACGVTSMSTGLSGIQIRHKKPYTQSVPLFLPVLLCSHNYSPFPLHTHFSFFGFSAVSTVISCTSAHML